MGLLDSLLGAATQGMGGQGATGGLSPDLMKLATSMLAGGGNAPGGGLGNIVQALEQGGLGSVVQSWIGNGQNLPISADQLQSVLGSEQVAQIAQQVGLNPADLTQHLSQLLPGLVDKLTPQGQAPAGGLGGLADLATQFLGNNKA